MAAAGYTCPVCDQSFDRSLGETSFQRHVNACLDSPVRFRAALDPEPRSGSAAPPAARPSQKQTGYLVIDVVEAKGLSNGVIFGTSSPQAEVVFEERKLVSNVVSGNLNPRWNACLAFRIEDYYASSEVCIQIIDKAAFRHSVMGEVRVAIGTVLAYEASLLRDRTSGATHVDAIDDSNPVWSSRETDPLAWDQWHPIKGGGDARLHLRLSIFFDDHDEIGIGPRRLNSYHRVCIAARGDILERLVHRRVEETGDSPVETQKDVMFDHLTRDRRCCLDLLVEGGTEKHSSMLVSLCSSLARHYNSRLQRWLRGGNSEGSMMQVTTPLHLAAAGTSAVGVRSIEELSLLPLSELLLKRDESALTPLAVAAGSGNQEALSALIAMLRHIPGETALAVISGRGEWGDKQSMTPLMLAASRTNADDAYAAVSALLDGGADPFVADAHQRRALHYAASAGHTRVCSVLLERGALKEARDDANLTASDAARVAGHAALAATLAPGGASAGAATGGDERAVDGRADMPVLAPILEKARTSEIWAEGDEDYEYGSDADADAVGAEPSALQPWKNEQPVPSIPSAALVAEDGASESKGGNGDDSALPSYNPRLVASSSIEVMAEEDVAHERVHTIREAAKVLRVGLGAAGSLLRAYNFNVDALVVDMCDDREATLERAAAERAIVMRLADDEDWECEVCFDDKRGRDSFALGCGHVLCRSCWADYLQQSLKELGPRVVKEVTCPHEGCASVVDGDIWQLLARPGDNARFEKYLLASFVSLNENMVWCPADGCHRAVRYSGVGSDVACLCGTRFCFSCFRSPHSPASCATYERFMEEKDRILDEATHVTLMKNFKRCPKCRAYMERNQGCNHGYEFCWMCKGPWSEHGSATGGYFSCNKHNAADSKKRRDVVAWEGYSEEELAKLSDAERGALQQKRIDDMTRLLAQVQVHDDGASNCARRIHEFEVLAGIAPAAEEPAAEAKSPEAPSTSMTWMLLRAIKRGVVESVSGAMSDAAAGGAGGAGGADGAAEAEPVSWGDRKRFEAVRDSLIALQEFHRVERWTLVHLMYMKPGPEKELLEYKQKVLQQHADKLHELTDPALKLAGLDMPRLRSASSATEKFARGLVEEIEFMEAVHG